MIRGRKPIPPQLKVLAGNPGHRPINLDAPRAVGRPSCPKHLSDEAKREWRRMSRRLAPLGLLSNLDGALLASYCVAFARWVEAEEKIKQFGLMLIAKKTHTPYPSPYLPVANKAMDQMLRLAGELGMSPISRSRLAVSDPSDLEDEEDRKFFEPRPRPVPSRFQGASGTGSESLPEHM